MSTPAAPPYVIRPAEQEDLPSVLGIYNWAVNQTFATIDAEPLSQEEAHEWWHGEVARTPLLVAQHDGEGVIGFGRLMPWKQRGFQIVEDLVYVDPLHHGRGVGRQILEALLEEAHRMHTHSVVASMATDNVGGLRLHEALGFEVVGTLRQAANKFDRWMDITLVQKML